MSLIHRVWFLDISIHPDYSGLPPNVLQGLQRLADNTAALLILVSAIGIGVSLLAWVIGAGIGNHMLIARAKSSLLVAATSGGILYLTVAGANYMTGIFRS